MKKTKLTCVIPAYNEATTIEESVSAIVGYWANRSDIKFQLIVVDDGSQDETPKLLKTLKKLYPSLKVIFFDKNMGKGQAVKAGVLAARSSEVVYFIDADLPFSLSDQKKVVEKVSTRNPVIYGSRYENGKVKGGSNIRSLASSALRLLNRVILNVRVEDNQCGLKAFDTKVAITVFKASKIQGFSFDLFLSAWLSKQKIRIKTVPVTLLPEKRASAVGLVKESLRMIKDMLAIRKSLNR